MTQFTASEAAKHWLETHSKTKGFGTRGRIELAIKSGDDVVANIIGITNRDKKIEALCDALVELQTNAKIHPSRLSITLAENKDKIIISTNNRGWGDLVGGIKKGAQR